MKLIVTGHAAAGKDTLCEILEENTGLKFGSSSLIACEEVVLPVLGPKYGYTTVDECFNDRNNHRSEWYDLISEYNREDPTRLGKHILFQLGLDVYCGLRNIREFQALVDNGFIQYTIWVDRSKVNPPEPNTSITVTSDDCDYVLDNNGAKLDLLLEVGKLIQWINDNELIKAGF
jgi:hypothetical protein